MSRKKGLGSGDRVYLRFDMLAENGAIIPAGTIGSIREVKDGVPQVHLGDKHGVKAAAPSYLIIIDVPGDMPLPADGTFIEVEDLIATLSALTWDLHCTQTRLRQALHQAPVQFGRS